MELGLKGKYALVTGGSHGIGRSIALSLAEEGCNVAICARGKERLEKVGKEIEKRGVKTISIVTDVLNPEEINRTIEKIISAWGTLHILVNNVGGGGRWGSEDIEETSEDVWYDVYNKNLMATVRFTLKSLPYMKKQNWGRVVTIASIYGKQAGGRPWFNVAKTAQITLMKNFSLKFNFTRKGITFNTVSPGAIMIPDTGWELEEKKDPKAFKNMINEKYPIGRLGTPEEVACVVTFLCSEKASLVNGANIIVDGSESVVF